MEANLADQGINRTVRVRSRATGIPGPEIFELADEAVPLCPPGGVLVRVLVGRR